LEALQVIGARKYASVLASALRLFNAQATLKMDGDRQAALQQLNKADIDKRYGDPIEDLDAKRGCSLNRLLLAYLKRHQDEFFRALKEVTAGVSAKAAPRDYRLSRKKAGRLRGVDLHWALIENIWDDYWEAMSIGKREIKAGSERFAAFIAILTPGQRALVAIRVLNNMVRIGGWQSALVNSACRIDVLHNEIRAAYHLLNTPQYAELFERVVRIHSERLAPINTLTREFLKIHQRRKRLRSLVGDRRFAEYLEKSIQLIDQRGRLEATLAAERRRWREEFLHLADSRATRVERYIQAYVDSHAEEFVRD
jgi:hypothetical protein